MVIDFHAHVYEARQAKRVIADMAHRAQIPAFSDGTLSGLLRSMDEADIDISVISRITTRPEQVATVNDWLRRLQGPRTIAMCTMHPELPGLCDEVVRLRRQGFRGFKLHPDYQGFFVDEQRMFPFYEAAAAADMWILFHAGLDRGLPGHQIHATPARLRRVHEAFPRLPIIAAHMGGEANYEETEELLLGRDIYLDTSFVLRKMPLATLERFCRRHPRERLLFGTDTPWSHQGRDLAFLRQLPFLSSEEADQLLWKNAAILLGVDDASCARRAHSG